MQDRSQSEVLRLGKQVISIESGKTAAAYSQISSAWSDQCPCAPCRNFAAQRGRVFPSSFIALLTRLGVDPSKESEVYGCYPMPSGRRQYGGWFFFCGSLIETGEGETEQDGVSYWVRGPGDMPASADLFQPDPLALEFTIQIPWVLFAEDPDEVYGPPKTTDPEK